MAVTIRISHDPNNPGAREERIANLDAAASGAMKFGWSCTITVPSWPSRGQPEDLVYTFAGGVLVQGAGHTEVDADSLAWWSRRASEPGKGSQFARVTIREASGRRHTAAIRGNFSLIGVTERYCVEAAIAAATVGDAHGLYTTMPGHVRGYDFTRIANGEAVDIDLRGAAIEAWERNDMPLPSVAAHEEPAAAPTPRTDVRPVLGAIGDAPGDSVYAREVAARRPGSGSGSAS